MIADRHAASITVRLLSYGARGVAVGVAVAATWSAAGAYAGHLVGARAAAGTAADAANGSGVALLGDEVALTVGLGLPATLVVGLLLAWVLRLPRPWAVPLVGVLLTAVLCCGAGIVLSPAGQEPDWGHGPSAAERLMLPLGVVVLAHLVAALLVARRVPVLAGQVVDD